MTTTADRKALFAAYTEACNYPGKLDESEARRALSEYLGALGIQRNIVRIPREWGLDGLPSLKASVLEVLRDARDARDAMDAMAARDARDAIDAMAARDARDARDAMAARDARDAMAAMALYRFAAWCIMGYGWWYYRWDLSWIATTYLGALELGRSGVAAWSKPLFQAFLAGADFLYWTDDTLYWVAKPVVRVERIESDMRRLHCEDGPALVSDVEDLYFWHGVLVPAYVVRNPHTITIQDVRDEDNAEVRRVMMERMGWERFCDLAEMQVIHEDELHTNFPSVPVSDLVTEEQRLVTQYRPAVERAQLLEALGMTDFEGRPLRFVRVTDPSTDRRYTLRVLPEHTRCYEALGWTFPVKHPDGRIGLTEEEYKSGKFLRQGDVMLWACDQNTNQLQQQHS